MSSAKGIYVSPTEFVAFASAKKPPPELALRRSRLGGEMHLPNPDPVLKTLGKDVPVYRDLLTDASVGGAVRRRKAAVIGMERGIDRGKAQSRVAQRIDRVFRRLKLRQIISEILDATLFGYQPLEVIWRVEDGLWLPDRVVGKPPEWFCFGPDNGLRLRTPAAPVHGEPVPPHTFLLPTQDASYDNPYGFPDLSRVFWPTTFKKGGLKFWVAFTEKYGSPFVVGKEPRGTTAEETESFLDRLDAMVQDAVAVIPDDASVTILEAGGRGASAEVYRELLMDCRSEIAIALLGQNQSTESDSTHASATAGLRVAEDIRDGNKALVEETLNELIAWVVDKNWGDAERPVFEMWAQEEVDTELATRDKTLRDAGAVFRPTYFARQYGIALDEMEAAPVAAAGQPPLAFAEADPAAEFPDQASLDAALDTVLEQGTFSGALDAVLAPVIEAVRGGLTSAQLNEKLAGLYPSMDGEALQERVARVIFVANVWGRIRAQSEEG